MALISKKSTLSRARMLDFLDELAEAPSDEACSLYLPPHPPPVELENFVKTAAIQSDITEEIGKLASRSTTGSAIRRPMSSSSLARSVGTSARARRSRSASSSPISGPCRSRALRCRSGTSARRAPAPSRGSPARPSVAGTRARSARSASAPRSRSSPGPLPRARCAFRSSSPRARGGGQLNLGIIE